LAAPQPKFIMTIEIQSPVSPVDKANLLETVPASLITAGYQKELGINVQNYFTGLDEIGIYQCCGTGYRFYHPTGIFGDGDFYTALQQKSFYYSEWNWEHTQALRQIPAGSRVLEVGCGTGSFTEALGKKGFDCTGLELNSAAVAVCQSKGLAVYNELLNKHLEKNAGRYDVVCAFQVLEHIYDVHTFLNECLQCLRPGGILIVAVPNNNPWFLRHDKYHLLNLPPHHAGLWNEATFRKLDAFFPVKVRSVQAEPLLNRVLFLQVWLRHHRMNRLLRLSQKIRPGILNRLLLPLQWLVKGKCLQAVFEKK
jgi:SAM-dependent methyltransferase